MSFSACLRLPFPLRAAVVAVLMAPTALFGSVLLIDFGGAGTAPTAGGTWNTVESSPAPTSATDLVFSDGSAATGVEMAFTGFSSTSTNQGAWSHGDVGWVDDDAVADYIWHGDLSTITITGLDVGYFYEVSLVSARATSGSNNRVGDYLVQGLNTTISIDSLGFDSHNSGWNAGEVLTWQGVETSDGSITLLLAPDSGNTIFINALRIEQAEVIPESGTYALLAAGLFGLLILRRRQR